MSYRDPETHEYVVSCKPISQSEALLVAGKGARIFKRLAKLLSELAD